MSSVDVGEGEGEGVRLPTPSETEEGLASTYTLPILSDDEDEFEFLIQSGAPHGKAHRVQLTHERGIVAGDKPGAAPPTNTQEQASNETAQRRGHMPRKPQDHGTRNIKNAKSAGSIFARRVQAGAGQPVPWTLMGPVYTAAHRQLPVRHTRQMSVEASVASSSSSTKPSAPASRGAPDGMVHAMALPPVRTWSTDGNVGDHTEDCGCAVEEAEDEGALSLDEENDEDDDHHDEEDEYWSNDDFELNEDVGEGQDDLSSHGKKVAAKSTPTKRRKSRKVSKELESQQKQSPVPSPCSKVIEPISAHDGASDNHTYDSFEAATTVLDTTAYHEFWASLVAEGKVTPEIARARSGGEDTHFKTAEQLAQEIADEEFARKVQAELQEELRWTDPEFGSEVGQFSGRKFP